nr:non-canonical non-ribosomal peptide synthetase fub8 [Quercus suber]
MRVIAAPPTDYWLQESAIEPFPYLKNMAEAKNDPFSITHSSGSTGIPKPISFTQGSFMGMVSSLIRCEDVERLSHATLHKRRVAVLTPLMIAVGFFHTLGAPFSFGYTPVIPCAHIPMDIKHLAAVIKYADVSALVTSPKLLPEVLEDDALAQEFRKKIYSVIYAGAPLSRASGKVITSMTKLSSAYGSTETGVYPVYSTSPEDWEYHQYDPIFHKALQPVNSLGYHEIVLPRIKDPSAAFQSCFDLYPNEIEWRTRDLFIQHDDPSKKHLWRYAGRIDDLIIDQSCHSTPVTEVQKQISFLTIDMEAAIIEDERIEGAIICENRGGALAVVIEPIAVESSVRMNNDEYLNAIWPTLEKSNKLCPVGAEIKKDLIIVAKIALPKGAKGNIQRRPVQEQYASAIDEAYDKNAELMKPRLTSILRFDLTSPTEQFHIKAEILVKGRTGRSGYGVTVFIADPLPGQPWCRVETLWGNERTIFARRGRSRFYGRPLKLVVLLYVAVEDPGPGQTIFRRVLCRDLTDMLGTIGHLPRIIVLNRAEVVEDEAQSPGSK